MVSYQYKLTHSTAVASEGEGETHGIACMSKQHTELLQGVDGSSITMKSGETKTLLASTTRTGKWSLMVGWFQTELETKERVAIKTLCSHNPIRGCSSSNTGDWNASVWIHEETPSYTSTTSPPYPPPPPPPLPHRSSSSLYSQSWASIAYRMQAHDSGQTMHCK